MNPYGLRLAMINNNAIGNECHRYSCMKTWDYVVKHKETSPMRKKFVEELLLELPKAKPQNVDGEEMLSFVEDIVRYPDDDDSEEGETNQGIVGIRDLFRGCIVKVWTGTNFSDRKYHKLNKIAVR